MNICNIMFAVVVLTGVCGGAYLLYKVCKRAPDDGDHGSNKVGRKVPTLDTMIEALDKKALAYALYREMLKCGVKQQVKDILYAKFGYVNLPPSLEEDEAFRICPQLMSDRNLLTSLNRWLIAREGHEHSDFFPAATEVGRILVEAKRDEARQIVSSTK